MAWPMTGTTKDDLRIRSAGNTNASILTVIPKGASVTVTGEKVNGWYPVTYGGKSGWASAAWFNPLTASPPVTTPSTPPTPAPIPHTQGGSNPFLNPDSTYGSNQNWYNTPFVKDNLSPQNPQGEFERYLSKAGMGGLDRIGQAARSLYDRTQTGYAGASLNNPDLSYRAYLNDMLGANFLRNQIAGMSAMQRGEQWGAYSPRVRWVTR